MSRPWPNPKRSAAARHRFVEQLLDLIEVEGLPSAFHEWTVDLLNSRAVRIEMSHRGRMLEIFFAPGALANGAARWTIVRREGGPTHNLVCAPKEEIRLIRESCLWLLGRVE